MEYLRDVAVEPQQNFDPLTAGRGAGNVENIITTSAWKRLSCIVDDVFYFVRFQAVFPTFSIDQSNQTNVNHIILVYIESR